MNSSLPHPFRITTPSACSVTFGSKLLSAKRNIPSHTFG
jgi:hypothetical protein